MLASLAMSAGAQSKISPSGLMMLHEFNQLQSTMSTDAPVPEVGVIVRLTDGYTTEALRAAASVTSGSTKPARPLTSTRLTPAWP